MGGGLHSLICLFLVLFSSVICLSNARSFTIGGKDGWTLNPSENYNTWSQRQRFIVNDDITFKYPNGSDSVLGVTKEDYESCNISDPITKMEDGNSVFKLDRPGPFYFISGNKSKCDQGQKIALVVISPRGQSKPKPTLSPLPPPVSSPPMSSPGMPPAMTPMSSPPSPEMPFAPTMSPGISPTMSPGSSPTISPGSSPTMSPGSSPTMSPGSSEIPSSPGIETPVAGPTGSQMAPPPASFAAAFTPPPVALLASLFFVVAL